MCKKVTNADYKQFSEELRQTSWIDEDSGIKGELKLLNEFVVTTDREITLQQVYEINRIYKTRLSDAKYFDYNEWYHVLKNMKIALKSMMFEYNFDNLGG